MGKEKRETSHSPQVRISTHAAEEIDEITRYIAIVNQQPINAVKVGDAIFEVISKFSKAHLLTKNVKRFLPKQKSIGKPFVYRGL